MKKKLKLIGGMFITLACLLTSCSNASKSDEKRLTPHYLLTGTLDTSYDDEVFDYYVTGQDDQGNNEYAISLKSSIKETYTGSNGTILIPSVYPGDTDCRVTGIWHDAFYKTQPLVSFLNPLLMLKQLILRHSSIVV